MSSEWHELTKLTQEEPFTVERVRLCGSGVAIEGSFELPPLAKLPPEDQVFVMAFVKCDGSIKEMERLFGISYPTVKNRLSRIAGQFEMVDITSVPARDRIIQELKSGRITAAEAIERLKE